jgi:hypothetical protein
MPDHRVPDDLAHYKTRPGCLGRPGRVRGQCVYDEPTPASPHAATHDDPKVLTAPQSCGNRQHSAPRRRPDQADSVSRPLRRRAAKMARPARVRIRSRNPWTRERRRLFGWKVRLPLLTAQLLLVSTFGRPLRARHLRTLSGVSCLRARRSLCLLPTCGFVTSSDDKMGTRNAPAVGGRLSEGTHPLPGHGNRPLGHARRSPATSFGHDDFSIEWQHAVHRETLAPQCALWQGVGPITVPLLVTGARVKHPPSRPPHFGRHCGGRTLPKKWRLRPAYV